MGSGQGHAEGLVMDSQEKDHPKFEEAFALLELLHHGAGNVELRAKSPDGNDVRNKFFPLPLYPPAVTAWLEEHLGKRNLYYGIATRGDKTRPDGRLSGGADNCFATIALGVDLDLHDESLFSAAIT